MNKLETYDPNVCWGTHVVEVKLQCFDYVGGFQYKVRGNRKGLSVIYSPADYWFDERGGGETIILYNNDGDELYVEIWEYKDLEDMIVGIRIVDFMPDEDCDN